MEKKKTMVEKKGYGDLHLNLHILLLICCFLNMYTSKIMFKAWRLMGKKYFIFLFEFDMKLEGRNQVCVNFP